MKLHPVRTYKSEEELPREDQLAWQIAEVAADPVEVDDEVVDMIINRVIDNAAVAAASLTRAPVVAARAQALAHPYRSAARARRSSACDAGRARQPRVGGLGQRRRRARARLPRHLPRGRVLAPGRQHPADPRGRAARRRGRRRARARHRHRLRDPDRPGAGDQPARAQDRPRRPPRPVGRRRHRHAARPRRPRRSTRRSARRCTPRPPRGSRARARSRPGRRTPRRSPARWPSRRSTARCAARLSPSPIYEGEDGVIAWLLDGPDAAYEVPLPERGRGQARASSTRYTKEHSAEYQAQALIDLARKLGTASTRSCATRRTSTSIVLHTSHHTHYVIGSGANDPQKYDPTASPRDARPLDPVHLHGRAAGRRLAPRRLLRARARRPRRHRRAVAQGHHRRGRRSGPAATTRSTRPRRRSAAASRSR